MESCLYQRSFNLWWIYCGSIFSKQHLVEVYPPRNGQHWPMNVRARCENEKKLQKLKRSYDRRWERHKWNCWYIRYKGYRDGLLPHTLPTIIVLCKRCSYHVVLPLTMIVVIAIGGIAVAEHKFSTAPRSVCVRVYAGLSALVWVCRYHLNSQERNGRIRPMPVCMVYGVWYNNAESVGFIQLLRVGPPEHYRNVFIIRVCLSSAALWRSLEQTLASRWGKLVINCLEKSIFPNNASVQTVQYSDEQNEPYECSS